MLVQVQIESAIMEKAPFILITAEARVRVRAQRQRGYPRRELILFQ